MKLSAALLLIGTAMAGPSLAQAPAPEPMYRVDAKGNVIALGNLTSGLDCLPDRLSGRVVKRTFNDDGILLQSFVLEYPEGERDFINVSIDHLGASNMVTVGHVVQGLQRLVREGRVVDIAAQRCGAAGRVLYLDAVLSSRK